MMNQRGAPAVTVTVKVREASVAVLSRAEGFVNVQVGVAENPVKKHLSLPLAGIGGGNNARWQPRQGCNC